MAIAPKYLRNRKNAELVKAFSDFGRDKSFTINLYKGSTWLHIYHNSVKGNKSRSMTVDEARELIELLKPTEVIIII